MRVREKEQAASRISGRRMTRNTMHGTKSSETPRGGVREGFTIHGIDPEGVLLRQPGKFIFSTATPGIGWTLLDNTIRTSCHSIGVCRDHCCSL